DDIVALINGEPIIAEELRARLIVERASVSQYFQDRYGASVSAEFWTSTFGGETPIKVLGRRALDGLVRTKVQIVLMRDHGIVPDATYAAFLRNWRHENQRRREVLSGGGSVYGPQQFSEESYYAYVGSNGVRDLRKVLASSVLAPTEEDLRTLYEAAK